jgi:hypothetical protein
MVKSIFAAVLGVCMLISSNAGAGTAEAVEDCAHSIIIPYIDEGSFSELAMAVAYKCEAEIVLMADEAGLSIPEDQEEYAEVVFYIAAGTVGEILRRDLVEIVKEYRRTKV